MRTFLRSSTSETMAVAKYRTIVTERVAEAPSEKVLVVSEDEKCVVTNVQQRLMKSGIAAKPLFVPLAAKMQSKGSQYGRFATFQASYGFVLLTNGTNTKTLCQLDGVTTGKTWASIVASMTEIAQFDAIFDEIFVHKIVLHYIPLNQYNFSATVGTSGNLQDCAATIVCQPNNAAAYVDAASTWYAMRSAPQSRTFNLGTSLVFAGKNNAKFAWDGPMGDQSSAHTTQEWINIGNISTAMGGLFQIASARASTTVASTTTFGLGDALGDVVADVVFSMRARA